ncbi:MAG: UrcA family protein [Alphaproteobacteria bacterium]|nr:UrcA family protein [Alphaproteobacteria bacterium]
MKTKLFAAALTLAAFAAGAPANASDVSGGGVPSLDVTFSDLNLANRAGAEVLLRRIRTAASQVCGGDPHISTMRDLRAARDFRSCVRTAVDGAVRQVNAPLVTALHRGVDAVEPRYAEDLAR